MLKGEHCLLQVEKRNCNTEWVAGCLARHAGVPRRDLSYAGMKDRHAVTRQWFSLRMAGRSEPDWQLLESDQLKILEVARHGRKLRPGALRGNRFRIRVRGLYGDRDRLGRLFDQLSRAGMPNYFGEQRFGHDQGNLQRARELFVGKRRRLSRHKQGLYLSAARALLFNQVLAHRMRRGNWNRPLAGERMMLDGSRNSFPAQQIDRVILERHSRMDIHTSGPLWGRGESGVFEEALRMEQEALEGFAFWCSGIERSGMAAERRALRAPVRELTWSVDGDCLELAFFLPRGSYATSLLRECVDYRDASADGPRSAVVTAAVATPAPVPPCD